MAKIQPVAEELLQREVNTIVNNFSITIATVNGSGSQTSNLTLLRALFKMGIPVSGKNLFPSNIQGEPTWYTIRVNKDGFIARREENEIIVAMNPATFLKDQQGVLPGGALLYPDDIKLPIERNDITIYPMPVKELAKGSGAPQNLRNYVANMVYLGILAQILGIDTEKILQALKFHFKGRETPIDLNYGVVKSAYEFAQDFLVKKDPYRVEPMDVTRGLIMADGNTAAALGSIYGGVHFVAWYPITPASTLAEVIHEYLPKLRKDPETGTNTFVVVQAEDELAAIGMAIGAGWGGLRAMTSTSGPGLSLMTEYMGLAYFAEIPVVVWDVQRVGPSTGLPTRTSQGDLIFAAFMGHGDTQYVILLPGSVDECFEFGWKSFDLAERLQSPVIILTDLDFGMNQWMAKPFMYPDESIDRGKVLWEEDLEHLQWDWARYKDIDGDGITYRTLPGNRHPKAAYFARGTGHDEYARYTEDAEVWHQLLMRLKRKHEVTARKLVFKPVFEIMENADIGVISFGSTTPAILEACHWMREQGVKTDFLRLRAIPFTEEVGDFIQDHQRVYVVEMNRDGQLKMLLAIEYPEIATRLISLAHTDGLPLTARQVFEGIMRNEEA